MRRPPTPPKPDDLFAAKDNDKEAPCGFLPLDGWPHKWAREAHVKDCYDCARARRCK